jgi:hypothetical protein
MRTPKIIVFFILIISFTSCIRPEKIKTIDWVGNTITLSVINGGATTSYLYKIEYKRKWIFGRERLIFWSYSTPSVDDISVENNKLIIHCFASKNQANRIVIDLKNINKFIGSPVKYRRDVLEKTNDYYDEPNFIKQDRQQAKKYGLID